MGWLAGFEPATTGITNGLTDDKRNKNNRLKWVCRAIPGHSEPPRCWRAFKTDHLGVRRFVVLSWVLIACFGLDGCALVILPAQIVLCASAPAGAGCQGMADLSAAEAGGRGGR